MNQANSWFFRIRIYLTERYPPLQYIIAAIVSAIALDSVVSFVDLNPILNYWRCVLVAFNIFIFPLIMRICDEVKDIESDQKHFPERAIPSGRVKISDVIKLGKILFAVFVFLNTLVLIHSPNSIGLFLLLNIYLWFFLKYFYMPNLISNNILLALLFSNPITLVLSFYNLSLLGSFNFMIGLLFWIPSWIWEISRKIRTKENETEYQTYSMVLGIPLASTIPVFGVAICALLLNKLVIASSHIHFYQSILGFSFISYFLFMFYFVFKPNKSQQKILQKVTELTLMVFLIVEILLKYLEKI